MATNEKLILWSKILLKATLAAWICFAFYLSATTARAAVIYSCEGSPTSGSVSSQRSLSMTGSAYAVAVYAVCSGTCTTTADTGDGIATISSKAFCAYPGQVLSGGGWIYGFAVNGTSCDGQTEGYSVTMSGVSRIDRGDAPPATGGTLSLLYYSASDVCTGVRWTTTEQTGTDWLFQVHDSNPFDPREEATAVLVKPVDTTYPASGVQLRAYADEIGIDEFADENPQFEFEIEVDDTGWQSFATLTISYDDLPLGQDPESTCDGLCYGIGTLPDYVIEDSLPPDDYRIRVRVGFEGFTVGAYSDWVEFTTAGDARSNPTTYLWLPDGSTDGGEVLTSALNATGDNVYRFRASTNVNSIEWPSEQAEPNPAALQFSITNEAESEICGAEVAFTDAGFVDLVHGINPAYSTQFAPLLEDCPTFVSGETYKWRARSRFQTFGWGDWSGFVTFYPVDAITPPDRQTWLDSFPSHTDVYGACDIFTFSFATDGSGSSDGDGFDCLWTWIKYLAWPPEDYIFDFIKEPMDTLAGRWPFVYVTRFYSELRTGLLETAACPLPSVLGGTFFDEDVPEVELCDWFDGIDDVITANQNAVDTMIVMIYAGTVLWCLAGAKRFFSN